VQPHAGPARPAEAPPHVRLYFAGEDPFLDIVDPGADLVGDPVHGIGDLVDDLLQQRGNGFDAVATFKHAAGGIDRAQRLMAAADQQPLGHREPKESGLLGCGVDVAHQIGEHAVDAMIRGVQLLIIVLRQQQLARQRWDVGSSKPGPRPRIGQVEMEPQPAVMAEFDRHIDRQRLGAAVA